jgi:hypothetical protein
MRFGILGGRLVGFSRLDIFTLCGLAVGVACAASFAMGSLGAPIDDKPPETPKWRPPSLAVGSTNWSKAATLDKATLTRPVFSKSRRPLAGAGGADMASNRSGEGGAPRLRVNAIVKTKKITRIFIVSNALAEGKWLAPGETIDGWTFISARQLEVILRDGARTLRLEFSYDNPEGYPAIPAGNITETSIPPTLNPLNSNAVKIRDIRGRASPG